MANISENLRKIKERVQIAASRCGKDASDIKLVAVAKTKPAALIREVVMAGHNIIGENYAQEIKPKANELKDLDIEWHFIGHLQRNKIKHVLPYVKCIHSLDSVKLAEEIEKRAQKRIDCLIEINLAGEDSKTGIEPDKATALIAAVKNMKNINLIGFMTMPPFFDEPERARPYFKNLKKMFDEINEKNLYTGKLTELSMGMSGDFEVAIEEGATIVRIGTAIFGERR